MARPKEFDIDVALDAAVEVFREHGFAGTSAQMLTAAMRIGKQSLYDTFGGKWQLYCAALEKYGAGETRAHIEKLQGSPTALEGLEQMLERVVLEARRPCLGVGSINEFSDHEDALIKVRRPAGRSLRAALLRTIREAKQAGDLAADLDPKHAVAFVLANVAGIRIAARGGADPDELRALARLAIKALK
ncbi:TetR/AcrR family transcriptional regulator [Pseudomonas sp. SZMC_28357]|uniref:TetR/AcrR family transcriptional regulator n=1 Tax=Pseudomonas sp. SZMC_28357 TaxID=3074380 RepID=UPI0028719703|nr:TetR/AcrR family transcriptional regulator [Pseudomonas sp. SZMC_28357]MDR9753771.1 TetR/AcrR family transcriptional regulator [Pseudomonas sp. SZMC_28357]